jgi:hypothetical protein
MIRVEDIQTGDLLHCRGNGVIAKLISFFTKSKVTHTAVAIRLWGQLYIIDAQRKGIIPRSFYSWCNTYKYKFEVQRNPKFKEEKDFAIKAMSQSGTDYDFELLLVEYPHKIIAETVKLNLRLRKKFESNDRFICSEYAMWCHGIEQPYKFTPKLVKEYCYKNNWITIGRNT